MPDDADPSGCLLPTDGGPEPGLLGSSEREVPLLRVDKDLSFPLEGWDAFSPFEKEIK